MRDDGRGLAIIPLLLTTAALLLGGCSGSADVTAGDGGGVVDRPPDQALPNDGGSQPDGEPAVTLSAADNVVASGQTTTLTWTSEQVSSCSASGGWSGTRPVAGSTTVGPITQSTTYTLNCSGDEGSVVAMISVGVISMVTLSWQAPTQNTDGSALNDLAGYRIYLGSFSGQYSDDVTVNDPSRTSQSLQLASGDYYIAMTAVDGSGNESGYSNEIVRTVN